MRLLYIILIFALTYTIGAQQVNNSVENKARAIKTEKSDKNVIDFNDPAQKIKPVKVINHERAEVEQNRKMGLSKTSGPAEILEKKQNVESELTNKDLQRHLKTTKTMRPMRQN